MAKDAYYFSHDSNAKDDPKCVMLIEQLGLEGYGIFWVLVEMLRDQPGYRYPLTLIPAIARRYNTSFEKMKTVINNYQLFEVDDHDFFSLSLFKRMEYLDSKRIQASIAGKASAEARARLNASSTDVQQEFNGSSTIKVNKTKAKESKTVYIENVSLLDSEHKTLIEKYGETNTQGMIQKLSFYKLSNGKTYKSDYGAINSWVADKVMDAIQKDKPRGRLGVAEGEGAGPRRDDM